jgi:TolB-like protein/tRNA A-37 threonylcarbamoyl transferase component Bud32/tetratricopeptide (TPR) repeat protein
MTDTLRGKLETTLGAAYTLERELGGGGMSRVFVACENALGRTVVIKVLSPDLAEALNVERFRREIQLAARLQHPHIVPLLTAGESGGLPYFTMPFIQGESLRDRLKARGELPVSDAVRVLREVAAALAYAHGNGVVHRDIKPDNVMISGGSAMVMDFGVAKAVTDAVSTRATTLTQLGVALGTPAYMAPEQAAADPTTDHRADIYAFGVMAYEVLTGETPFAGRPAQAMLAAHAVETPEPISRRRPAVPAGLAALIMRCLEKRPSDRPQAADEIVRILDEQPTSTEGIRAISLPRRSHGWLVGAALGALVVVGGAALLVVHQQQLRQAAADAPTMIAVLPFFNQGPASDQYFTDGLTDAITNRLASLHGLGVIDSRSAAQYKGTTKTPKQIGHELGVQYLLQGTVQWATDERGKRQVQISPSLVEVATLTQKPAGGPYLVSPSDVFRVQTEVATKVADALNVALNGDEEKALAARPTMNPQAYDAYLRGQAFDDQNEGYLQPDAIRNAIDAYTEATRLDPKFALAFAKLGADQLRWAILDVTDSARVRAARQSIDSSLVLAPDLAEGHQAHAHFLGFFMDDRDGAYSELVRASALKPNDAALLSELGHQQIVHGLTEQGFANIAKAVRLDPRSLDAIERATRENYNARRYGEAERYANQYITLAPTSPIGYNWKINCEIDGRGDTAAARQTLETAVSRGARWSISLASQYTNLGPAGYAKLEQLSLADLGVSQFIDSSQYYAIKLDLAVAEGRQSSVRAYGDSLLKIGLSPRFTGPLESWRYAVLASAYAGLGRRAESFQQLALAEQAASRLSADDSHRGNMEEQIAQVFGTLGEADSSIAHIKKLLKLPSGFSKETAKTDVSFAPLRGKPAWEKFLAGQ